MLTSFLRICLKMHQEIESAPGAARAQSNKIFDDSTPRVKNELAAISRRLETRSCRNCSKITSTGWLSAGISRFIISRGKAGQVSLFTNSKSANESGETKFVSLRSRP